MVLKRTIPSKIERMIVPVCYRVVLFLFALLVTQLANAGFEKEQRDLDTLLSKRQYASAASYVNSRPELIKDPRFLRKLSHILVTYYTANIDFHLFAVKDLKDGERLEDARGIKGTHQMVGGDWERVLYDALKANPDSPDINFAVGEYLSRGDACGCGRPRLFAGEQADEYQYLDRAYKGGIYDYWSLFRLGNYYLIEPHVDVKKAISFYQKSLELKSDHPETNFNLASAYYSTRDYKAAKIYAAKAIEQYQDPELKADAYANYARIEVALGDRVSGERDYLKAFGLRRWHERAFTGLLDLYKFDKRVDVYKKTVREYLALDYGNTYMFNVYVDYLSSANVTSPDREIAAELVAKEYARTEETGAVFFNLGRMSEMDNDPKVALRHYSKSLNAFKKLKTPPAGAVEALTQRISHLKATDAEKQGRN